MQFSGLALVLVAATVLIAACGDDDRTDQTGPDASPTTVDTDATVDTEDASGLGDDIAAVVNGEEITVASIDEHVDAFAENPQFAEQLEGPQGDAARTQLRAQILSSTIVTNVVAASAEELGDPVTDDDIAEARGELEEQVGGAEALEAALDEQGLTESLLHLELTSLAAMRNVEDALAEEAGDVDAEEPTDDDAGATDDSLSPSAERAQDFLTGQLAGADVVVNEEFGTWSAQTGQVAPPGAGPHADPGSGSGGGG